MRVSRFSRLRPRGEPFAATEISLLSAAATVATSGSWNKALSRNLDGSLRVAVLHVHAEGGSQKNGRH
jgi:hypothetical protein